LPHQGAYPNYTLDSKSRAIESVEELQRAEAGFELVRRHHARQHRGEYLYCGSAEAPESICPPLGLAATTMSASNATQTNT
jgi:hypothetical protein